MYFTPTFHIYDFSLKFEVINKAHSNQYGYKRDRALHGHCLQNIIVYVSSSNAVLLSVLSPSYCRKIFVFIIIPVDCELQPTEVQISLKKKNRQVIGTFFFFQGGFPN